jgi:hypothetical protein
MVVTGSVNRVTNGLKIPICWVCLSTRVTLVWYQCRLDFNDYLSLDRTSTSNSTNTSTTLCLTRVGELSSRGSKRMRRLLSLTSLAGLVELRLVRARRLA